MASQRVRYVTDIPYSVSFVRELAPDWLDFIACINGFQPRAPDEAFAWCELGCGNGLTAVIHAVLYPDGLFHAIDTNPDHISFAKEMAGAAGVENLTFHTLDFGEAIALDLPKFDYIVAHGVYAWIDDEAIDAFHRFIDRHLAPGGLVYVSYNAMPGWASDAPLQYLIHSLAQQESGNSRQRFEAAAAAILRLTAAGAPALAASPKARDWETHLGEVDPAYFPHEYLAPAWRPRYVTEVRAAFRTIGLRPIGSAHLKENFDGFVLGKTARAALEEWKDDDQRELIRDYFLGQPFRRDVFARAPQHLEEDERRKRLLSFRIALTRPANRAAYAMQTRAGTVRFDNTAARRIVTILSEGPRRIGDCIENSCNSQDIVANILALASANMVRPVPAKNASVARLNQMLLEKINESSERVFHVLPWGITLRFERALFATLAGEIALDENLRAWSEFFKVADQN